MFRVGKNIAWLVLLGAFLASGGEGRAALITPVDVRSTSYWSADNCYPANLINSSGLSANAPTGTHDNHSHANTMWIAGPTNGGLGGPTGSPPSVASQAVVFDLGHRYDLVGTWVWNQNQVHPSAPTLYQQRGTKDFNLYVSSDTDPLTAAWTPLGGKTLAMAGGTTAEPAQWVPFAANGVRLVKFDIQTAYSGAVNEYVGLGEVRFDGLWSDRPAGVIDLIYYDGFSRAGSVNLHGTPPPISAGGATWTAHADWKADGSISVTQHRNAFLPFEPEAGTIYRLSMDVNPTEGARIHDWFGLGFTSSAGTSNQFSLNSAAPWALLRVGRTDGEAGYPPLYTATGPGNAGFESYSSDSDIWTGVVNLAIELDTRGDNWTAEWFVDGEWLRTHTYTTNPTIHYVGFGAYDASGLVRNFQLAIVPEPGGLLLLVSALVGALLWRRR